MTKMWPDITADISVTHLLHSSTLVGEGGMGESGALACSYPA
jgi:hypothetical protein